MTFTKRLILTNFHIFSFTLLFCINTSLQHVFHWGPTPNIAVIKSFQSYGILMFWVAQELNIMCVSGSSSWRLSWWKQVSRWSLELQPPVKWGQGKPTTFEERVKGTWKEDTGTCRRNLLDRKWGHVQLNSRVDRECQL